MKVEEGSLKNRMTCSQNILLVSRDLNIFNNPKPKLIQEMTFVLIEAMHLSSAQTPFFQLSELIKQ